MMRLSILAVVACVGALSVVACSDSDDGGGGGTNIVGGTDGGNSGTDAGKDSGKDTGGTNTPKDSGKETEAEIEAIAPYGTVALDITSGYILDWAKVTDEATGDAYLAEHPTGFQTTAAITGTYTSKGTAIPPADATRTIAMVAHAIAQKQGGGTVPIVLIKQISDDGNALVEPDIEMQFSNHVITTGNHNVGNDQSSTVSLVVKEPSGCWAAIGLGKINVTVATNTDQDEGGALTASGTDIKLYHPTNVPLYGGDVSATLKAQGIAICAVK